MPHAHSEAGAGHAYLSSRALMISSDYTDTQQMLARSTNQSRAAGFGPGQAHNFSHAQHQPFGQQFGQSNPVISSTLPAAQLQQTCSGFGPIPHQAQPANGPFAAAQSQPPAIYTPQVFQQVVQPVASSAQHCFPTWNPSPQVAQAPSHQPHPVATTSVGIPQGRPRAAMPTKLAAIVCPALSLNCRQGHGLICISGKPARYPTWGCDLCHQLIPHDTKYVMHCDKCASDGPVAAGVANGFDICPACRAKSRDAMSVWPLIQNAAGCPMFPGVGDYWQTLYCHRQQAPCKPPSFYPLCHPPPMHAPCGPRGGAQCLDCKRGQDAIIACAEGKLFNRAGRVMIHVCFGDHAGMYFCSECSGTGAPCCDCKFTQTNLPEIQ